MNAPAAIPAFEYDGGLIVALMREELRDFSNALSDFRLTREQELRGALLAWFCYFCPELIPEELRTLLLAVYYRLRQLKDFDYAGWYQALPIQMAMYGLTRDQDWLASHKQNFAYGGSALRLYVLESLALAAPELNIDDDLMYQRARRNLELHHGCCQWNVILFLSGRGPKSRKLSLLRQWGREFKLNPDEERLLGQLAEWGFVENHFFAGHFLKVQSYILQRLCASRNILPSSDPATRLFAGSIATQTEQHALMQSLVELKDS